MRRGSQIVVDSMSPSVLPDPPVMAANSTVGIIVPTLNAAGTWAEFQSALVAQKIDPAQVLIVDSASTDNTPELARASGFRVTSIARSEFNHGGTRQWATRFFPDAEILVYLTQDAILAGPNAIEDLLTALRDPQVGVAYGRQLPRPEAGPIEAHGRLFNYPAASAVRSLDSRDELGFKTIFVSNSFAVYRRSALEDVGGFPVNTIFGEDTITAARMLLKGWKIAYVADACVYHSHEYTAWQEFKRYFDIGVLHTREAWLLREFGRTAGEGRRFVLSELNYLRSKNPLLGPLALLRTAAKFAGYKLGTKEAKLGSGLKHRISMHRGFWQ